MATGQGLPPGEELRLGADRIHQLILHSDLEWPEIERRIGELREACRELLPERVDLFDMIYAARFERLWRQWRLDGDTSWTWREDAAPLDPS